MKKNNKKGFTIVELVIVIAVIAILSAVLIPTFGSIIDQANASAAQQEARNEYTEYLIDHPTADIDYIIVDEDTDYCFDVADGFKSVTKPTDLSTYNYLTVTNGVATYTAATSTNSGTGTGSGEGAEGTN